MFLGLSVSWIYPVCGIRVLCLLAEIAVACGHFSTALHLCVEPGEDPDKQAFSRLGEKKIVLDSHYYHVYSTEKHLDDSYKLW